MMTPGPKIIEVSAALNTGARGDWVPQRRFILHSGGPGISLEPIRGGPGRRTMPRLVVCFLHSPRVEDVRMQFNRMYPGIAATGQMRAAVGPIVYQSCAA